MSTTKIADFVRAFMMVVSFFKCALVLIHDLASAASATFEQRSECLEIARQTNFFSYYQLSSSSDSDWFLSCLINLGSICSEFRFSVLLLAGGSGRTVSSSGGGSAFTPSRYFLFLSSVLINCWLSPAVARRRPEASRSRKVVFLPALAVGSQAKQRRSNFGFRAL